jgi:hypothetical protein
VAIRSFRSISGNPVALTNAGMDHIAKRHPELKNVDLADKIVSPLNLLIMSCRENLADISL